MLKIKSSKVNVHSFPNVAVPEVDHETRGARRGRARRSTLAAAALVLVAGASSAGCSATSGGEQIESTQQQEVTSNSLNFNSLNFNSLNFNSLIGNALIGNALIGNSLIANSLIANSLESPSSRDLLGYIVSCALPASESVSLEISGAEYTFDGGLGLAPEWGKEHGFCDLKCQEWVSACLLARLDYTGAHREISVRGRHPALVVSAAEKAAYPNREATYFGNVFTAPFPQRRFACLSPGQTEIPRVCGPTLQGCAVDVDDTCDEVCGGPTADGAFTNCRPGNGDSWYDRPYHGSITVYLP